MRITTLAFLLGIFILGCNTTNNEETSDFIKLSEDAHSYANINDVRIKHLHLDLAVDFDLRILDGSATLVVNNYARTREMILDTRDLEVSKVVLNNGQETEFSLGETSEIFGTPLTISIEPNTDSVTVFYKTSPTAAALQWLIPEQTLGKKHPFLFSQSQAILARSWIPCQDGPGVKFTYSAEIQTSPDLIALMSAENGTEKNETGLYSFTMNQPVSSYLMALAIGDLNFKSTGRNSGVYAEPELLDKAVWEFQTMQSMIDSAEQLYGEYIWERYDVLVLPPSFPFGGMENPRLTFATPTIIAGDQSLVALIAHELAHSWSGNLVTNETWNDFWLNEGFTVYFEQRIMEKIYGKDYEEMLTKLGMGDLEHTIERLTGKGEADDTHLYLELDGRDPDDGLTDVAYEKGRFFLQTVEAKVGRARFDEFLKNYFTKNAFKPMNTERFVSLLESELLTEEEAHTVNSDGWIYGPGIPENAPSPNSKELDRVELAISQVSNGKASPSEINTNGFTTHHWLYFLRGLKNMDADKLLALDKQFKFTETGNSEIACDWFKHCIENNYKPAYPALDQFLNSVGRRKFLQPLYERLAKTPENLEWAKEVYKNARSGYHSVSYTTIDEILGLAQES